MLLLQAPPPLRVCDPLLNPTPLPPSLSLLGPSTTLQTHPSSPNLKANTAWDHSQTPAIVNEIRLATNLKNPADVSFEEANTLQRRPHSFYFQKILTIP